MRAQAEGRTLRALGFALLVPAAVVALPAFSAAQDAAPAEPAQPVTAPAPPPATPAPSPAPDRETSGRPGRTNDRPEPEGAAVPQAASGPSAAPAAAGEPGPEPRAGVQAKAASANVSTGDNFYSPTSVSIFAGETVTWTNNGQAQHSATANDGSFDTGVFGPGASRSATFRTPGTFSYYCIVHGLSQSGTVRVAAASGGGGSGGSGSGAGTSASTGSSEAAAVASPDAAGTSTSLPATGFAVIGLGGTGLLLLLSGLAAERRAPPRRPEPWFTIR